MRSTPRARMASARYLANKASRKASSWKRNGGANRSRSDTQTRPFPQWARADGVVARADMRAAGGAVFAGVADDSVIDPLLGCEETRRSELDERDDDQQYDYLGHRLVAEELG